MVEQVYAHLGTIRHRSEYVEFRVEQHEEALRDRLPMLGCPSPGNISGNKLDRRPPTAASGAAW